MPYLPAVEIEPANPATASVIWLHGLGADGHDFEPIVPELRLPRHLPIRFIFPHAPAIPVTINGGYVMPAWYDILEMTLERKVDLPQLQASADAVIQLIEREKSRGIRSERIVLAGFSQGGAVAYQAALTYAEPLAGLMAMSTYFATADSIHIHPANRRIPIHIFHGTQDDVVPEILGRKAEALLKSKGYQPEYTAYPMAHSVCAAQVRDIAACLQTWLVE